MAHRAHGVDVEHRAAKLPSNEAQGLLVEVIGTAGKPGPSIATLAEVLGCSSLAIVQAGAYIRKHTCSIGEYLDIYWASREQILKEHMEEVRDAGDYEIAVYATWRLGYLQIKPLSRQLYNLLAFMHHDQITEDIFRFAVLGLKGEQHALPPTHEEERIERMTTEFLENFASLAGDAWDKPTFLQAIDDLVSYSLVTYDSANCTYSIHPLVQQWARTVVTDPDATRSCVAFLLALSILEEYKTEDLAFRRLLLNHVDCLPDSEKLRPRRAWRLRLVYHENGRATDEERLVKAEYEANMRLLGGNNTQTLTSMGHLATIYSSQGRLGDSELLLQEVVEVGKRVWGNEHPKTLGHMSNLQWKPSPCALMGSNSNWCFCIETGGSAVETVTGRNQETRAWRGWRIWRASTVSLRYASQGRWSDAEVLQRQVLEVGKRVWGSEDPNTLTVMGNLAMTYSNQGQREDADLLLRKVVEAGRRVWGTEHPNTLIHMGNLAQMHSDQGRWGDAEALQREVLEVCKRVRGSEHPETLLAMGNLALTYSHRGRRGDAELLLKEAVEVRRRLWGNEHPGTLLAMGNLASTYWEQGRWEEAETLQREVIEVGKGVWGNEHPDTLRNIGSLAAMYSSQGRWKDAEPLQRELLQVGRRVRGNEDPKTLEHMNDLAKSYSRQGQWGEAESLRREVLEAGKRVWGVEHPTTLAYMSNLALSYSDLGKWSDAEPMRRELVEVGKRVWGNEHPDTLYNMYWLGVTCGELGQVHEAESWIFKAFEGQQRILGDSHPDTRASIQALSGLRRGTNNWSLLFWSIVFVFGCWFFSVGPFGR